MAKHLIVCGHGQGDPGAVGNGITEEGWTRNPLAVAIMKYAKQLKNNSIEIYDTSKNLYTQTKQGFGAYSVSKSYSSVTECHLDSAKATATGGHVIISSKFNPDSNDLAIANVVEKYVGWWGSVKSSQGINKRSNLLNLNVFAKRGISYRLVELGFISSKTDTDKLKSNVDAVAKAMVEAITGESLGGSVPAPKPVPSTPAKPEPSKPASNQSGSATIKDVQTWLNTYSFNSINVDGFNGPITKRAIIKVIQQELNTQFNAGLVVDGLWGPKTRNAWRTVRKGAKGNLTRCIQALLICRGYSTNGFDGDYGSGTASAVGQFQAAATLVKDKIAGRDTISKLVA